MLVKVWNDNTYDYKEKFRDRDIVIKAKGFIMMDRDEAEIFQGSYAGMTRTGDGQPDPRGFKMIRLELDPNATATETQTYVCHFDGKKFQTQAELDAHEKQYKDKVVVDEVAEQEIKRRGRPRKVQGGVSDTATSRGSGAPTV